MRRQPLALTKAPAFAQTAPKKLIFAHVTAEPESSAVAFAGMAQEVTEASKGELEMEFHGGTLLTKELEIMNAVKSGNIAMGDPGGAAATVFPEMGVFLVPYLVASYDQAYKMFNGQIGEQLDKQFQEKYKLKVLFFYRLRLPPFLDQQEADRRAEGPARPENARAAGQGVRRHDQWPGRHRRADGVGRGHPGGEAGRDRRRRPADRQHPGAEGLRGLEILLDDLSQLRADLRRHESRPVERAQPTAQEADARRLARGAGQGPRS